MKILVENGADINIKDSDGNTILLNATECGYADIIKLLVDAGADINITGDFGQTALHWAVYHADPIVVKYIIKMELTSIYKIMTAKLP